MRTLGFVGLSCPSIAVYNGEGDVSEELDNAGEEFLVQEVSVSLEDSTPVVKLSKILYWYGSDFGETERDLVEWIREHVKGKYSNAHDMCDTKDLSGLQNTVYFGGLKMKVHS